MGEGLQPFMFRVQLYMAAASHLLSRADVTLQLGLVPGSICRKPDSDGGRDYGLDNGSVEVHQHLHRQVKLTQSLAEPS